MLLCTNQGWTSVERHKQPRRSCDCCFQPRADGEPIGGTAARCKNPCATDSPVAAAPEECQENPDISDEAEVLVPHNGSVSALKREVFKLRRIIHEQRTESEREQASFSRCRLELDALRQRNEMLSNEVRQCTAQLNEARASVEECVQLRAKLKDMEVRSLSSTS